MSIANRKKLDESLTFVRFACVSGAVCDGLEQENWDPPYPDIRSAIEGQPYFFELGEIPDDKVARRINIQFRTRQVTGGPFSQSEPLLRMFRQKCQSHYVTNGAPIDLVLYYSNMYPYEPLIPEFFKMHAAEIESLLKGSPFTRIWIYSDWQPRQILWCIAR